MELRTFVLCNDADDEVCISNYGARLLQWHTDVFGQDRNIILGYSTLRDYLDDPFYLGAIVGPYANRIEGAAFSIDEQQYVLQANDGIHHLHGGDNSTSHLIWEVVAQETQVLTLKLEFSDGHNGYPGAMTFWVTYHLNNNSSLDIDLKVTTEQVTVIGPTLYPFFNLAGVGQTASGHILQIFADKFIDVDDMNRPTGEICSVEDTVRDFRQPRVLDSQQAKDNIDLNFVNRSPDEPHGVLISPDKQLQLHISSTYPSLHVNTGQSLGGKFERFDGICLAPQFFPNSPNIDNFPFHLTTPEEPFKMRISYKLVKNKTEAETLS